LEVISLNSSGISSSLLSSSLLLSPQLLPEAIGRRGTSARMSMNVASWYDSGSRLEMSLAEAEAPVEEAVDEAPAEAVEAPADESLDKYSPEEQIIRQYAKSWGAGDQQKLASVNSFDVTQDPSAVKAQLIGTWKLLVASENDSLREVGLSGAARKHYETVVGHYQTFSKPDPMALFSGKEDFFMIANEVFNNARDGVASQATLKGGFYVGPMGHTSLGFSETYTRLEVDGAATGEGSPLINSWDCTFLSDTLRVCRAQSGAMRVYEKVEADAANAELSSLRNAAVTIDPAIAEAEAEAAAAAAELGDDEDDPNDTRPEWQKRIDKADGIKRTKNGTPIINYGPPTA